MALAARLPVLLDGDRRTCRERQPQHREHREAEVHLPTEVHGGAAAAGASRLVARPGRRSRAAATRRRTRACPRGGNERAGGSTRASTSRSCGRRFRRWAARERSKLTVLLLAGVVDVIVPEPAEVEVGERLPRSRGENPAALRNHREECADRQRRAAVEVPHSSDALPSTVRLRRRRPARAVSSSTAPCELRTSRTRAASTVQAVHVDRRRSDTRASDPDCRRCCPRYPGSEIGARRKSGGSDGSPPRHTRGARVWSGRTGRRSRRRCRRPSRASRTAGTRHSRGRARSRAATHRASRRP